MMMSQKVFREDEKAIYTLRALYSKYGYSHYRVSKFEEYDLYAKNKSFLVSENLLTFTDTNGKLMALKPDITLSIIKNAVADDKASYRLCYDEHVYRTTSSGDGFREITQTGLEAIGDIDLYTQCEVIMLAMRSMESISPDCLLDLSHMSFLEALLENAGVAAEDVSDFLSPVGAKNLPELRALCRAKGIEESECDKLCAVTAMYLPIKDALVKLKELDVIKGDRLLGAYRELCEVYEMIKLYGLSDKLYLDFSVVNDMNYYDGVIFKGFVNGIPDSILSGGRYDRLVERFGKKAKAIGFAVYLDKLERFNIASENEKYDVDIMLVYDAGVEASAVIGAIDKFTEEGMSVRAVSAPDSTVRCRKCMVLDREGVRSLEAND